MLLVLATNSIILSLANNHLSVFFFFFLPGLSARNSLRPMATSSEVRIESSTSDLRIPRAGGAGRQLLGAPGGQAVHLVSKRRKGEKAKRRRVRGPPFPPPPVFFLGTIWEEGGRGRIFAVEVFSHRVFECCGRQGVFVFLFLGLKLKKHVGFNSFWACHCV